MTLACLCTRHTGQPCLMSLYCVANLVTKVFLEISGPPLLSVLASIDLCRSLGGMMSCVLRQEAVGIESRDEELFPGDSGRMCNMGLAMT